MTRHTHGRQQTIEIRPVYFFFSFFFNIYVLIKYISINIVWNKYLEYMNIGLANIIPSK
jgi:hypothetical protein